jgi:hypothetical protein
MAFKLDSNLILGQKHNMHAHCKVLDAILNVSNADGNLKTIKKHYKP